MHAAWHEFCISLTQIICIRYSLQTTHCESGLSASTAIQHHNSPAGTSAEPVGSPVCTLSPRAKPQSGASFAGLVVRPDGHPYLQDIHLHTICTILYNEATMSLAMLYEGGNIQVQLARNNVLWVNARGILASEKDTVCEVHQLLYSRCLKSVPFLLISSVCRTHNSACRICADDIHSRMRVVLRSIQTQVILWCINAWHCITKTPVWHPQHSRAPILWGHDFWKLQVDLRAVGIDLKTIVQGRELVSVQLLEANMLLDKTADPPPAKETNSMSMKLNIKNINVLDLQVSFFSDISIQWGPDE